MKVRVSFENMAELKRAYDPYVIDQAARATIKQLQGKAATVISKAVRDKYTVPASAIKSALKQTKMVEQEGAPAGYLIYLGKRMSLSYFATGAKPRVKTARGVRYGARAKLYKGQRAAIIKGGFFGKAQTSGSAQIFQRVDSARLPIRKLTAPSISQMVGGGVPLRALNDLMQRELDEKFSSNLEHFMQKQMGLR
jgi:hypothetical protein